MAKTLELLQQYQDRIAGLRSEIDNYYTTETARIDAGYMPRIQDFEQKLKDARKNKNQNLVQFYDKMLSSTQQKRESALKMVEDRSGSFSERRMKQIDYVQGLIDEPSFQSAIERERAQIATEQARAETAKVAEQRRVAAEQARVEREVSQREQAERQAGRFRARGSRAAGRPMLSAARMSPEQSLAPSQSLGAFMPK